MVSHPIEIEVPRGFRLSTVVLSHGWYDLSPFQWKDESLHAIIRERGRPCSLTIRQPTRRRLLVHAQTSGRWCERVANEVVSAVDTILGLPLCFDAFYRTAGDDYNWARRIGAGRFLRSQTVFEDAVKMLATTNCSWSLTRLMIDRLISALGEAAPCGRRAFPTPQAMAEKPVSFYRDTMRAGYRSAYFKALAEATNSGDVAPESWSTWTGSTASLIREIRRVPGLGRYAAENLCKLLGRFDGLGLDSWCLKKFEQIRGRVRGDVATAITRHYERFEEWKGLALWLDLTRDWHQHGVHEDKSVVFEKQ